MNLKNDSGFQKHFREFERKNVFAFKICLQISKKVLNLKKNSKFEKRS